MTNDQPRPQTNKNKKTFLFFCFLRSIFFFLLLLFLCNKKNKTRVQNRGMLVHACCRRRRREKRETLFEERDKLQVRAFSVVETETSLSQNDLPPSGFTTATLAGAAIPRCPSVIHAAPLKGVPASGAWFAAGASLLRGPAAQTEAQAQQRHARATCRIATSGGRSYSSWVSLRESRSARRLVWSWKSLRRGEVEKREERERER